MHCAAQRYSITSSAQASSAGGTLRPSALAVLRLMTKFEPGRQFTGRSLGLVPSTFCPLPNRQLHKHQPAGPRDARVGRHNLLIVHVTVRLPRALRAFCLSQFQQVSFAGSRLLGNLTAQTGERRRPPFQFARWLRSGVRSVTSPSQWNYLAVPVVVAVPVPVVVPVRRTSRRSCRPARRTSRRSCRPARRS
jgi:hypothetical protein